MATEFAIRKAIHIIRNGGIIAYPTDTVYGLGCDPFNPYAVNRLNHLKSRDSNKGLILLGSNLNQFKRIIDVTSQDDIRKIQATDKPTSWIVPVNKYAPAWLIGDRNSVAIRISQNPMIVKLCSRLSHPVVSTSANPSGNKTATNSLQLHNYFHDKVDAILVSGSAPGSQPSTIKWLHNDKIIRP